MKKTLALALASIILILVSSAACIPSNAADYAKVGVKTGDWAEYSVVSTGYATEVYNRMRVDFLNVSGTTITIEVTTFYPNSSLYSSYIRGGDISTRKGGDEMFQYVIAAGLSEGDSVYPESLDVITETVSTPVLGITRVLNHYYSSYPDGFTVGLYWDKESGLMVELYAGLTGNNLTITLVSTSVFPATLYLVAATIAIVGSISAVVAISVLAYVRSRRRVPW